MPASISTSSPSRSRICRATCRWCGCPTNAPITRKMPASCMVGAFEPKAKPWGGDGIAEDHAFVTLPEDMDHFEPILDQRHQPRAAARNSRHRSSSSTGRKASRPDDPLLSRRGAGGEESATSPRASIRSASSPRAVPAWCSSQWIKNGHPPMDCERHRHPPHSSLPVGQGAMCATARSKASACSMPCTGPIARRRRRAGSGVRPFTTG